MEIKKCTMQNVYSNKNKNQNPEKRNNKKWQQIYDQKLMNKGFNRRNYFKLQLLNLSPK